MRFPALLVTSFLTCAPLILAVSPVAAAPQVELTCDIVPYSTVSSRSIFSVSVPPTASVSKVEMYLDGQLRGWTTQKPFVFRAVAFEPEPPRYDSPIGRELNYEIVAYDALGKECGSLSIPATYDYNQAPPKPFAVMPNPPLDGDYVKLNHLKSLSLGFSEADVVSIDQERLKEGFVLIKNAQGDFVYELPMRRGVQEGLFDENTNKSRFNAALLTSKYIFIPVFVKEENFNDLLGALRPTGRINALIPISALDIYLKKNNYRKPEAALEALISSLPDDFLLRAIKQGVQGRCRQIADKRVKGIYLSEDDVLKDIYVVKKDIFYALNLALFSRQTLLSYPQFQFERPLVHIRNLLDKVQNANGKPVPIDAIRILNYDQLMRLLCENNYGVGNQERKVGVLHIGISAAKVSPNPFPDNIGFIEKIKPWAVREFKVMDNGNISSGDIQYRPFKLPENY